MTSARINLIGDLYNTLDRSFVNDDTIKDYFKVLCKLLTGFCILGIS